jgi:hypothetical protein
MSQTKLEESKDSGDESSGNHSIKSRMVGKFLSNHRLFRDMGSGSPTEPLSPVDMSAFDRVVAETRVCLEMKKRAEKALSKEQGHFIDKMRELEGFAKYDNPEKIK